MTTYRTALRLILFFSASFIVGIQWAAAQTPFDNNDFIIVCTNFGGGEENSVFDENLVRKGSIGSFGFYATGYGAGRVAVAERYDLGPVIRIYNSDGSNTSINRPSSNGDIEALNNGNFIVSGTTLPSGNTGPIKELGPTGAVLRTIGTLPYRSVAVVPGNLLWAGMPNSNMIDVFDLSTGLIVNSFALTNGQDDAFTMHYSPETNTVLITDQREILATLPNVAFELDLTGAFLRAFAPPVDFVAPMEAGFGVTRGPGGDVFVTDIQYSRVYRWKADGTFASFSDTFPGARPADIVWTGSIPEPTAGVLALAGAVAAMFVCRRR